MDNTTYTFGIVRLKDLKPQKFLTKDELYNAVQDCGGLSQCVAFRYHVGTAQWFVMEASEY